MLVQICCSVDSAYFLTRLRQIYPNEKIVGFFYDPNIHPYGEFCLRLNDVKRNARKLGIQIIAGEYDIDAWFEITRGLENEPEKGARCLKCFEFRLEKTFKLAKNLGEKCVTTTLLMSPKKSFDQLNLVMSELSKKFEIDFIAIEHISSVKFDEISNNFKRKKCKKFGLSTLSIFQRIKHGN